MRANLGFSPFPLDIIDNAIGPPSPILPLLELRNDVKDDDLLE